MRVAVYVRVSTYRPEDQHRAQDTEMQKREILAYLSERNLVDFEVYEDLGYTGTKDARPALKRMLADCRGGRIQMVVCWKLDRLFRSLRHLVNTLDEFATLGVQFVALRDAIDLGTHTGRLMMQILGAVGEFEAAVLKERTLAGLANARAKGKRLGRKPKGVRPEHVTALLQSGATREEAAKALRVSVKTLQRVLKRA